MLKKETKIYLIVLSIVFFVAVIINTLIDALIGGKLMEIIAPITSVIFLTYIISIGFILNNAHKRNNYLTKYKVEGFYCEKCNEIFLSEKNSKCPLCDDSSKSDFLPTEYKISDDILGLETLSSKELKELTRKNKLLKVKFYFGDNNQLSLQSFSNYKTKEMKKIETTNILYFIIAIYTKAGYKLKYSSSYTESAKSVSVYGVRKRTVYYTKQFMTLYFSQPNTIDRREYMKVVKKYLITFNPRYNFKNKEERFALRNTAINELERLVIK